MDHYGHVEQIYFLLRDHARQPPGMVIWRTILIAKWSLFGGKPLINTHQYSVYSSQVNIAR